MVLTRLRRLSDDRPRGKASKTLRVKVPWSVALTLRRPPVSALSRTAEPVARRRQGGG
ncbi:MAG: hypothetical protein HOW71_31835 [Nonomuraea sp.]|nr:hypothetical protein [Nonomuraea sp.]